MVVVRQETEQKSYIIGNDTEAVSRDYDLDHNIVEPEITGVTTFE